VVLGREALQRAPGLVRLVLLRVPVGGLGDEGEAEKESTGEGPGGGEDVLRCEMKLAPGGGNWDGCVGGVAVYTYPESCLFHDADSAKRRRDGDEEAEVLRKETRLDGALH